MSKKQTDDNPIIINPTEIDGIMVEVHGLYDVSWKEAEEYIRHIPGDGKGAFEPRTALFPFHSRNTKWRSPFGLCG